MSFREQLSIYSLLLLLFPIIVCDEFMGPAEIDLKRIEKCGDDALGAKSYFLRHKVNRTHQGTDVNMSFPFPIDETVTLNMTVSKWGDGGWKPNFFDGSEKNPCEVAKKYFPENVKNIFELIGHPFSCPVVPGDYSLKDYVYDGDVPVPFMYGDFLIDYLFIKDNTVFICCRMYCTSSPKKIVDIGR